MSDFPGLGHAYMKQSSAHESAPKAGKLQIPRIKAKHDLRHAEVIQEVVLESDTGTRSVYFKSK